MFKELSTNILEYRRRLTRETARVRKVRSRKKMRETVKDKNVGTRADPPTEQQRKISTKRVKRKAVKSKASQSKGDISVKYRKRKSVKESHARM